MQMSAISLLICIAVKVSNQCCSFLTRNYICNCNYTYLRKWFVIIFYNFLAKVQHFLPSSAKPSQAATVEIEKNENRIVIE